VNLAFETRHIGRRALWFDRVDSTNTLAAQSAADPDNDGLVLFANEQTAGRGRQGRRWLSPPGCGVLMSVLLFPPERVRQPVLLTALAAVAVCETIQTRAGLRATIKWPNDVLVGGRKVCGILVEQGQATVIGIGLNVNTPAEAFEQAELEMAGSLCLFTPEPLDREAVARTLIQKMDHLYGELLKGVTGDLEARWRWYCGLLGQQVRLQTIGAQYLGRVIEMGFGAICVQDAQGEVRRFCPEIAQHIYADWDRGALMP
jgi:BirA family biotin operon repressor/biotin-[acetyl-CoA-carboxylase] ligase